VREVSGIDLADPRARLGALVQLSALRRDGLAWRGQPGRGRAAANGQGSLGDSRM
jgi:hypothetical protein